VVEWLENTERLCIDVKDAAALKVLSENMEFICVGSASGK